MLAILLDVARQPAFPCRPRSTHGAPRRSPRSARTRTTPPSGPSMRWRELLYGPDHPYGRKAKGTVASVEAARRATTCAAFHQPHGCALRRSLWRSSATSIRQGAVAMACSRSWKDWTAPPAEHVPVSAPSGVPPRGMSAAIEMPGKSQSDIAYGFNSIRRLDPRYYAYWMMNNVLGQFGLGGRLADNIRERQGHGVLRLQHVRPQPWRGAAAHPRRRRSGQRRADDRGYRPRGARCSARTARRLHECRAHPRISGRIDSAAARDQPRASRTSCRRRSSTGSGSTTTAGCPGCCAP